MNFHLLFEQSGTFKNALKSFGHKAFDYDILNEYGETDFQIDLFKQIELEFSNVIFGGGGNNHLYRNEKRQRFYNCIFPLHTLLRCKRIAI